MLKPTVLYLLRWTDVETARVKAGHDFGEYPLAWLRATRDPDGAITRVDVYSHARTIAHRVWVDHRPTVRDAIVLIEELSDSFYQARTIAIWIADHEDGKHSEAPRAWTAEAIEAEKRAHMRRFEVERPFRDPWSGSSRIEVPRCGEEATGC